MSNEWPVKTIGELCTIARGGSPRPIKQYLTDSPDGVNWIKISDATASSKYIYETRQKIKPEGIKRSRLVSDGDFLLSNSMSFGRPYIMRTSGCIHDGWLVLSDMSGAVDQDYLYHFLGSPAAYRQFDDRAAGSTVRNLNIDLVSSVEIPLPPVSEQKHIIAILNEAFAGIDTVIANTEKNLANAYELFDSYFASVMRKEGLEWPPIKLSEICENLDSKRIPITKSQRQPGNIPYYGASGVVDHVADYLFDEDLLLVSEDGANLLARTYPIAFSISGKTWVNNHAHVLRFESRQSQKFTEYYLNSIPLTPYVSGMAQPKLNQKALNSIPVPFPSVETQTRVVAKLDDLKESKERLVEVFEQKLAALSELKQSLLQKAFSGELTADAEKEVEEVVA